MRAAYLRLHPPACTPASIKGLGCSYNCRRLTYCSFQLMHMSHDDHAVQLIKPWRPKRRQNIITVFTTLPQGLLHVWYLLRVDLLCHCQTTTPCAVPSSTSTVESELYRYDISAISYIACYIFHESYLWYAITDRHCWHSRPTVSGMHVNTIKWGSLMLAQLSKVITHHTQAHAKAIIKEAGHRGNSPVRAE